MHGLSTRPSLREHIGEYLFDAIIHGSLQAGERVVEGTLARQLGVSQGTLREALQQLEHQGLVTKIERHGTFVVKLSAEDVKNIYAVRLELEPLAVLHAQRRSTSEDLARLDNLLKEMWNAGRQQAFIDLVRLDLEFHRLLWSLSGNACIGRALNAVCPPLFANFMVRVSSGELYDFDRDHAQHSSIVEVLRNGRPRETREAVAAIIGNFESQDVAYVGGVELKRHITKRSQSASAHGNAYAKTHRKAPQALAKTASG